MSESRTTCPFCAREPGERHHDECSRSRKRMRLFAVGQRLYKMLCRVRFIWTSATVLQKGDRGELPPGARRAVNRSKRRGTGPDPLYGPKLGVPVPLYKVPRMGTYEKRLHGPLRSPQPKEES